MELHELRNEIDRVDAQLVELFLQRMDYCRQIAILKKSNDLPVNVPVREATVLQAVQALSGPDMSNYTRRLYLTLFDLSKEYQSKVVDNEVK